MGKGERYRDDGSGLERLVAVLHSVAGIWACDTYREHISDYPTDELFFVLEGTVTITEPGSEPQTYRPGDAFIIRRGTVCDFDAIGPFRKIFIGYEPQP